MWSENPSQWTILESLCYSSFVFATLVHGIIGYKFCWLLLEDQNQGTPAGHESTDTPTGHESVLLQKRYWIVITDQTGCCLWWKLDRTMTWLIIEVCSIMKRILNFRDQSNWVYSMIKTRHDNDVVNQTWHDMLRTKPYDRSHRSGICWKP